MATFSAIDETNLELSIPRLKGPVGREHEVNKNRHLISGRGGVSERLMACMCAQLLEQKAAVRQVRTYECTPLIILHIWRSSCGRN